MIKDSRLYGLYIHNLTTIENRDIALEAVNRFMQERPPMRHEYGDVIALLPDNEIAMIIGEIFERNGFIVQEIHPNQLYRLLDSMVVHYIFVDEFMNQEDVEQFIFDWETSMRLTQADMRYTRYLKTFFMKK